MKKTEFTAFVIIILFLIFVILSGCSTVAGVGKDITGAAEWTKEKVTQPAKTDPAK